MTVKRRTAFLLTLLALAAPAREIVRGALEFMKLHLGAGGLPPGPP